MKTKSPQTERKLLITALQHKDERSRNYILSSCKPEDFGTDRGVEIRTRMNVLTRAGKDLGDVSIFREDPTLSTEAQGFLACGPGTIRTSSRLSMKKIKKMVQTVQDYRKIRSLYDNAAVITELCTKQYTENTIQEAEDALLEALASIRNNRTKKVTHFGRSRNKVEVKKWLRDKMKPQKDMFVSTGLPHLDKHLNGWRRGDLVVVSAPRGGGKTAMLLQMMISQFRAGLNVGLASLEMDEDQLIERIISNVTDTKYNDVRLRNYGDKDDKRTVWEEWKAFELETSQKHNNFFSTWELKEANYLPENLELDMGPSGYDVIYVDYLSLFGSGKKDMWEAQKEHGRYLKQLAGRISPKCVIVLLTQLSKDERVKYGTGPEEDADYWLWWRYGEEEVETGKVEIRLAKARHARRGIIPAKFDLSKMQIRTTGGLQSGMSDYVDNQKKKKGKGKKWTGNAGKGNSRKSSDFDNPLLDAELDAEAGQRGYS